MKTIAITGASGFLASRLNEQLNKDFRIVPIARRDLNLSDEMQTRSLFNHLKPNYVIHTAAQANTNICQEDPDGTYAINVIGAENIAKACALYGTKMIFLSSEQVYNGNLESGPYTEDHTPLPNTVYGSQKLNAENLVLQHLDEAVILRLTWLFGLPEHRKKVSSNIIWNTFQAILHDSPLTLSPHEYRGMTYVYELVHQFKNIINLPRGIYNTGSSNDLSTYDIGCFILDCLHLEHKKDSLLIKGGNYTAEKPRDLRIDSSKLSSMGIHFSNTTDGLIKCFSDFSYI